MNVMRLNRHTLRRLTSAVLATAVAGFARAADRPNILFFFTDDQAPNMTGFEGNKIVKTPHLDRLASESVYFSRCYVPTPQCAPSRACVLTGQYPHKNGITTNGSDKRPMALSRYADTFTARLKRAGYECGIVGKWHLPYATASQPAFGLTDYVATTSQPWDWNSSGVWVEGVKKTADEFLTDWHGDRAIEFLERPRDKPFFLWLCFRAPHAPLVYPPGTENLYPPESVDLPATMKIDLKHRSPTLQGAVPATAFKSKNEEALREDRAKYYAMMTRIDENIGRVLDKVDQLGLRDNTVVVFASDNGWCLGEHALYSKGPFFYEELIRGPLLIRYPNLARPGTTIDKVVSLVDFAPTFCEIAGLKPPMVMQGQSLLPLIRNPETAPHADERFLEYDEQENRQFPARGIVTSRYKFIDYLRDTDVFYDLKRDPDEMNNAIDDPAYAGVVKVLRSRVDQWRRDTQDPTLK